MQSRGRSTPHRRIVEKNVDPNDPHARHPKFQCDYMFMRSFAEDKVVPCLSLVEKGGCVLARRLDKKSGNENTVKEIVTQLEFLGFAALWCSKATRSTPSEM